MRPVGPGDASARPGVCSAPGCQAGTPGATCTVPPRAGAGCCALRRAPPGPFSPGSGGRHWPLAVPESCCAHGSLRGGGAAPARCPSREQRPAPSRPPWPCPCCEVTCLREGTRGVPSLYRDQRLGNSWVLAFQRKTGGKRCGANKSCNQRAVSGASPWRQHGGQGAGGRARLAPRCSPLRGAGLQAEWTAKPGARTQKRGPPARGARHGDFIPEPPAAPAPSEHQARVLCSLLTLKIFRKLKGTALHPHGLGSGAPTSQRATPPPGNRPLPREPRAEPGTAARPGRPQLRGS